MADPNAYRALGTEISIISAKRTLSSLQRSSSRMNETIKALSNGQVEGLDGLMRTLTQRPEIGSGASRPNVAIESVLGLRKFASSSPEERIRKYLTEPVARGGLGLLADKQVGDTTSRNAVLSACRAIRATDTLNRAGARGELSTGDAAFNFSNASPSDLFGLPLAKAPRRPNLDYRNKELSAKEKARVEAVSTLGGSEQDSFMTDDMTLEDWREEARTLIDLAVDRLPQLNFKASDKEALYESTSEALKQAAASRNQYMTVSEAMESVCRMYDVVPPETRQELGEAEPGEGAVAVVSTLAGAYGKLELKEQSTYDKVVFEPGAAERTQLAAGVSKAVEEFKEEKKENQP